MKIVIFGLTVTSSWGNGHATLWRGLCKSLARRGHSVVFFERHVSYYASQRDLPHLPGCWLDVYGDWEEVLPRAREEVDGADVAMTTSYCPDAVVASDLILNSRAALKVFYDLDTPITLSRLAAGEDVFYVPPRGLKDFDLVLSYTGGAALTALQERLGARRVAPLYGHVDPQVHHPVPPQPAYRGDLSYLGTYASDRQAALESLFIEPARRLPDRRFLIGGAQYPADFPWTNNIFFVRHMPPSEHPAFFCSSRLTLSVTRQGMAAMGHCPSGRLFEAAACGCPLLSDYWEGLESFYEPGREILIAREAGDVTAALELSDAELSRIATAARERTLSQYTSERRAADLEKALEEVANERGVRLPAAVPRAAKALSTSAV
ncbi:MAG TPA: glycosyltransferase [Tepidisphaeraceae bacterium]|jgi:spore maturation protein CgeB|nr:glycosyltransferase [Tepidisphaeraceae bacterium]